jgi:MOSC domain-containing protein YiiM
VTPGGSAPAAAVVSVNVGLPRECEWQGKPVRTSIFKRPVAGVVRVRTSHLEGDEQSDPSVHGGAAKAVYAYPSEHYVHWRSELGQPIPEWGAFGENLTTAGLTEREVRIGDHLRIGTVELVVVQPRLPCHKLALRFGRPNMERRFQRSGLTGFYLSVAAEGELRAGDRIEVVSRAERSMTVAEVAALHASDRPDPDRLLLASRLAELPQSWRERFRRRLGRSAT